MSIPSVTRSSDVVISTESLWYRRLFLAIAIAIAAGFFYYTQQYWFPAHHGNDQNGYLVGAKRLLEHGSMQAKPADPFEFVGRMWVTGHEAGTYYPKYPIGLPAIYAVAKAIGGVKLVFLVNPIAMTLALLGVFALVRRLVGSFYGVLGMLVMACNPVTLGLTNNPNSHATAIFCVTWGIVLLIAWWQEPKAGWRSWARAVGSGFLLGMSVTIRYTEGLLLLPMGLCILYALWDDDTFGIRTRFSARLSGADENGTNATIEPRRERWRPLLQSLAMGAAWAVPVGSLLIVNKAYFDSWTGYDPTHESTAFLWANLVENWDTMLRQFYLSGLVFLFPLSLVGMCIWFKRNVRVAMVMAAWALPCVFIYTVYYWAPERLNLSYSRFFFTALPPLVATAALTMRSLDAIAISSTKLVKIAIGCAMVGLICGGLTAWKIKDGWGPGPGMLYGSIGGALVGTILLVRPASLLVLIGTTLGLMTGTSFFESETRWQYATDVVGREVSAHVPQDAVVFSKDATVHSLQFTGDWKCYSIDLFDKAAVKKLANQSQDLDNAQPYQAERARALYDVLKDDNDIQLGRRVGTLVDEALQDGKRTFLVVPKTEFARALIRFVPTRAYDVKVIATVSEPSWVVPERVSPWVQDERRKPTDRPVQWQIAEITRKAVTETTRPTASTTKASTTTAK